ncbi:MAG: dimethylarginine dimethylaminohydrolase [Vicinamibacteria bacterium]|jgi:dimethylargininase|nr:dimethylarginine dimethylaminohydrolase [Vicinamibacteria bacterium]
MPPIFHFDRALVRNPAPSVVHGLRAIDRGSPTLEGIRLELETYVAALSAAGVAVETLPALEAFPDSVFLEDPALVFPEGAIVLRPGAPSRLGEAIAIGPELRRRFDHVLELTDGFAEGGDILNTRDAVLIGLSARTTEAGAAGLIALLDQIGRRGRIVQTPTGVLHFKTDCSLLDEETILATARLAASGVFEGYRVLLTPEGEEAAANSLRVNDRVFVGRDFPRTAELLTKEGYAVVPLPNAQIALLDAGFSCLSLRWRDVSAR